MTTPAKTVHRLKVTLRQVKPPVWRRIEVPSSMKLSDLAHVLEAAMGWLGGHLHSFDADGVLYETPDGESFGFRRPRDERKARLGEVLPAVRSKMRWDYDFGEGMTTPLTIVNRYPCERHTRLHLDQQLRPDGEIDHDLDQVFAGSLDTDRAEKSLDAAGLRTRCRRTADG